MKCTVYWGSGGGFVVVPDCVVASREAERRFGPLMECARIDTDGLDERLAEDIGLAVDERTYACAGAELALHASYKPTESLPLPYGFKWESCGESANEQPLLLRCGTHPPVLVAELMPVGPKGGWIAITNCHKTWAFRGLRVAQTHMAAMHFIVAWANANALVLRGEILKSPAELGTPQRAARSRGLGAVFTMPMTPREVRAGPLLRGGRSGAPFTSPAP